MQKLLSLVPSRGLFFQCELEGQTAQLFSVTRFEINEVVSASLSGRINVAVRHDDIHNGGINASDVVEHPLFCRLFYDGKLTRVISGVCSGLSYQGRSQRYSHYELQFRSPIYRLGLRHNSRIFQQRSVPEIIAILLQERGIDDYTFSLREMHEKRDYCVQYQEDDLRFLQRLCAEEGILFTSEHDQESKLVSLRFFDHTDGAVRLTSDIPFNSKGELRRGQCIDAWHEAVNVCSSSIQQRDYHFHKPHYAYQQQRLMSPQALAFQRDDYEYYDYPGRYQHDEMGQTFSRYRLAQLRSHAHIAQGNTNVMGLSAGVRFSMVGHPHQSSNRSWFITEVTHVGEQHQALEEEGYEGETTYHNTVIVTPDETFWRGALPEKPRIDGPQIGVVVGPENEEIYCDKYGRVKVHFLWDRDSQSNEYSSCWVRVSQGWAGGQYGMMAIPRIGHEVIVSFLNNDPDRPIITGRTYHELNMPPYPLPENKTRTVWRTSTYQGQGSNELRFEDKAGSEEIYLHGQRDMTVLIEHDRREVIQHDSEHEIGRHRLEQVKGDSHLTVNGEWRQRIKGMLSQEVDASLHLKQRDSLLSEAGNEIHFKGGSKVVIEAGAEITLKAGGSFLKLDSAGVHVGGAGINLNAGGSASQGSGYAGNLPSLPGNVERVNAAPSDARLPSFKSSRACALLAQQEGAMLMNECQKS